MRLNTLAATVAPISAAAMLSRKVPYTSGGKTAIEIGHMIMSQDGPACPCGSNGCLEAYIAEDVLVSVVASHATCNCFYDLDMLLETGDRNVLNLLRPAARLAATALHNIRHIFEPDEFIVITRSQALSDFLAAESAKYLADRPRPDGSVPSVSGYRWDPITAGRAACDMVFDGFFS